MSVRRNRILLSALAAVLMMGLIVPAWAVDGVIEINQVSAKAGGVTPGDAPLFPVTISQPGSYRLTGNLDVSDPTARPSGIAAENMTAIQVVTDDVTIDLNGFLIKGSTTCSLPPTICSPTGTGVGIDAHAQRHTAVYNGTISGMGSDGVNLVSSSLGESQAERIRAVNNGGIGISATNVVNCIGSDNGENGINAITVATCAASGNGGTGVVAFATTGCVAANNSSSQIITTAIAGHNICGPALTPCP